MRCSERRRRRAPIVVGLLLLAATVAGAQSRPARVPIQADLIACVLPSDACRDGTLVRLRAGDRDLELSVLNVLQISNQLSVNQILTELRRFPQTAIAPREILAGLVAPEPLRIRTVIRLEARTLLIQRVQPADRVGRLLSR